MIGIIGAMEMETAALRAAMTQAKTETIAGMEFISGLLEGREAVVCTCGPGKVFAAACAQSMILRYAPQAIINSGVAGTLTDRLHIGDIAIAENAVQHDMDTSALGDPPGMISKINLTYLPCDAGLVGAAVRAARESGSPFLCGTIATGDQFVSSEEEKARMTRLFSAIACEMEGGAVAQVCYINGVKSLVLRVISDEADGGAPENFAQFAAAAAKKSTDLIRRIIKETAQ